LCVPSMGENQKGFKSPVYRMNIEEQKKLLPMQRTIRGQLRKGDRPWEGRLGESHQAMNKKSIRGRRGGMSWHNTAKSPYSAPEVNGTLGWRRFPCLPGEICPALRPVKTGSARRGNAAGDRAEVSRGRTSWDKTSRGAGKCPCKQRDPWKHDPTKDRTNNGEPTCAPIRNPNRRPAL
jgi:hypothetical protein